MRVTGFGRLSLLEIGWVAFAARQSRRDGLLAELGDDPVPLHLGQPDAALRLPDLGPAGDRLRPRRSSAASTGFLIMIDAVHGEQLWGELFEVPLMSAMFVAMVWHARRRQDALRKVEASGRGARGAARAAKAVPSRRLARAAYARDDCPRASRRPPAERARASPRRSTSLSTSSVGSSGSFEQLLLLAKTDHPDFVLLGDIDVESYPRGRLHALVGGRAARVASRPATGGIPARRPGGASDRSRLAARERRPLHGELGCDRAPGAGRGQRRSCSRSKTKAAVSIRTRFGTSSSASPERIPRGPARTAGSGWGSRSSTRSRRRTAEAAP